MRCGGASPPDPWDTPARVQFSVFRADVHGGARVQVELLSGDSIDLTTGKGPNGEPPMHLTGQIVSLSNGAPQPGQPVSAIGQPMPQPMVMQPQYAPQVTVSMPAPQPVAQAVTVSGPLDNLLKSLTADIAQDNLAIDALRTQVILK